MQPNPPLPVELRNDAAEIPVMQEQQQQPIAAVEGAAVEGEAPLFVQHPHVPSIGDNLAAAAGNLPAANNNAAGNPMMDDKLMGDVDGDNAAVANDNNNDAADPPIANNADNDLLMDLMMGMASLENPTGLGRTVGFPDGSVAISQVDTSNWNQLHEKRLVLFSCQIKVNETDGGVTNFPFKNDKSVIDGLEYALGKNPALRGQLNLRPLLIDKSTIQRAIDIGFTGGDVAFIERVTQRSGGRGICHTMKAVHLTTALSSNCLADFCEKLSWLMQDNPYTLDQLRHPHILKQLIGAGELGLKFFGQDACLSDTSNRTNHHLVRLPYVNVLGGKNYVMCTMQILNDQLIIQTDLLREVIKVQINSRRGENKSSYWRAWKESSDVYTGQSALNDFITYGRNIKLYSTAKSLTNFMLGTIRGDYQQAPFLPSWAFSIAQRIGAGDVIPDNHITSCLCRVFLVAPTEDDGDAPSIVFIPNYDGELEDGDNDNEEEEVVVDTDYFLAAKAKVMSEIIDDDFHPIFAGKPGEGTLFDVEDEEDDGVEDEDDVHLLVSFVGFRVVNGEQVVVLGCGSPIEGEVEEWYLRATDEEELSDVVENNLFAITSYGPPPVWYDEHPYLQVLRDRLAELEALSNEQQANASEPGVAAVSFETEQGVNVSESGVEKVEMLDEVEAEVLGEILSSSESEDSGDEADEDSGDEDIGDEDIVIDESKEEAIDNSEEEVVDDSEEEVVDDSEEESSEEEESSDEEQESLKRRRTGDRNSHMHNNAAQDELTGWD